jgi:hypothetical protein
MGIRPIHSKIPPLLQHLLLVQQLRSAVSEGDRLHTGKDRGVGVHWQTTVVALIQHSLVLFSKR